MNQRDVLVLAGMHRLIVSLFHSRKRAERPWCSRYSSTIPVIYRLPHRIVLFLLRREPSVGPPLSYLGGLDVDVAVLRGADEVTHPAARLGLTAAAAAVAGSSSL